jgi:tRNA U34 5-methylaminomethyl-2-thiouridine-forming methyltransferase MnmC
VGLSDFEAVVLGNGEVTVRDRRTGELMHPGLGPEREAELLYVRQTRLAERLRESTSEPLRVLDVGLGAATNALAMIRCAEETPQRRELHLTSLERDDGALRLALAGPARFPLQARHSELLEELLEGSRVERPGLRWIWLRGDALEALASLEAPQDILCFDPFSPEANPEMWSVGALRRFRELLAPGGVLSTYSASTRTRVTLLLAGFWVGAGAPAAVKKETTVASDGPAALDAPLGSRWLQRWRRSSARAPHGAPMLTPEVEQEVLAHPQFSAVQEGSAC